MCARVCVKVCVCACVREGVCVWRCVCEGGAGAVALGSCAAARPFAAASTRGKRREEDRCGWDGRGWRGALSDKSFALQALSSPRDDCATDPFLLRRSSCQVPLLATHSQLLTPSRKPTPHGPRRRLTRTLAFHFPPPPPAPLRAPHLPGRPPARRPTGPQQDPRRALPPAPPPGHRRSLGK